jgi:hypothetical protein
MRGAGEGEAAQRLELVSGTCGIGLAAYAAAAGAETGLTALASKPSTARLYLSVVGVSCSKRSPRFNVKPGAARQSFCPNNAKYLALAELWALIA